MTQKRWWTVVLLLGGFVLFALGAPSLVADQPALAGTDSSVGDEPTLVFPEEEVKAAPPGGTVQVNVMIKSDGGVGDAGVKSISLTTGYDQEYLELRDVQPRTWLVGEGNTDVYNETAIDEAAGTITVEQWRDPPTNGSTGTKLFATLTFDVREDASETNTTVTMENTSVELVDNYSMYVYTTNATITIDEQAEDPGKNLDLNDEESENSAAGEDETDDEPTSEKDTSENEDESMAASPVLWLALAGTAGVVVAGTLVWRRRQ